MLPPRTLVIGRAASVPHAELSHPPRELVAPLQQASTNPARLLAPRGGNSGSAMMFAPLGERKQPFRLCTLSRPTPIAPAARPTDSARPDVGKTPKSKPHVPSGTAVRNLVASGAASAPGAVAGTFHVPSANRRETAHGMCLLLSKVSAIGLTPPRSPVSSMFVTPVAIVSAARVAPVKRMGSPQTTCCFLETGQVARHAGDSRA